MKLQTRQPEDLFTPQAMIDSEKLNRYSNFKFLSYCCLGDRGAVTVVAVGKLL